MIFDDRESALSFLDAKKGKDGIIKEEEFELILLLPTKESVSNVELTLPDAQLIMEEVIRIADEQKGDYVCWELFLKENGVWIKNKFTKEYKPPTEEERKEHTRILEEYKLSVMKSAENFGGEINTEIREYAELYPVMIKKHNNRWVIQAFNQDKEDNTLVDLFDVITFFKENSKLFELDDEQEFLSKSNWFNG